jgi:DNA polymerase III delta prime subunit
LSKSIIKDLLGSCFQNDFLYVRDLSREIGKLHNLKISLPDDKKKQFVELAGGQIYEDIGTREISHWLQQSATGKLKIVLIENIERMTIGAANAFLKTAEEALPGRIIIATTGNSSALLDTIISRAVLVKFQPLPLSELLQLCQEQNIFSDNDSLRELVSRMVM